MLIAEKASLGSFSLKINTVERSLFKQIKLAKKKKKGLNLKQWGNKGTSKLQPVSLISFLLKNEKL